MSNIVLVGNRHVTAFKQVCKFTLLDEELIDKFRIIKLKVERGDKSSGDSSFNDFSKIAANLSINTHIISLIGGNVYNSFGLLKHPSSYDFYMREPEELYSQTIIPYSTLKCHFTRLLEKNFISKLRELKNKVFVLYPTFHVRLLKKMSNFYYLIHLKR